MVDGVVATCKKTSRWCPTHPHRLQIICPKQPAVWFSDINQANTVIPLGQTPESFQTSTNNLTKLQNHHKSALSLTFDSGQCVVQITAFSYGTVSRDVSISSASDIGGPASVSRIPAIWGVGDDLSLYSALCVVYWAPQPFSSPSEGVGVISAYQHNHVNSTKQKWAEGDNVMFWNILLIKSLMTL